MTERFRQSGLKTGRGVVIVVKKGICRTCLYRTVISSEVCCGHLLFTGAMRGNTETAEGGCSAYRKSSRKEWGRLIRGAKEKRSIAERCVGEKNYIKTQQTI